MVCVTALPHLASSAGAARIVEGVKIPHPCGRPETDPAQALAARVDVVRRALATLRRAAGPAAA